MCDIIEAAELLGRLKAGGYRSNIPILDSPGFATADMRRIGYDILSGGEDAIKDLFRSIAAQCPPDVWGVHNLYGWAHFNFAFKSTLAMRVMRLMNQVGAELGRRARIHTDGLDMDGECLMISEVAARMKLDVREVLNIASFLEIFQPHAGQKGRPLLIHRDDIHKIQDMFDNCLQRTEAAAYLGVTQTIFNEIVLAGHIDKLGTRWGEEQQDRFAIGELDAFLDRLPVQLTVRSRSGELLLSEKLLRVGDVLDAIGYDAGKFVKEVMEGELTLYARTSFRNERRTVTSPDRAGAVGLAGALQNFRISIADQPLGHPFTVRATSLTRTREQSLTREAMTMRQVAAHLDIDPPTVKLLADRNLIEIIPSKNHSHHYNLDRESVLAFGKKYIAGKLYASMLECTASKVPLVLRKQGILPIWEILFPGEEFRATALYERELLRQSLGLTQDPDASDLARHAWKAVADRLAYEKSLFAVWQIRDPAVSAMLSVSDRSFHMEVSYYLDDLPPMILRGADAYRLEVELEFRASEFRARSDAFKRCLEERDLHEAIDTWFDEKREICGARMTAWITIRPGSCRNREEVVSNYAEADTPLIARMLNMIKAAFEKGERTYDKHLFGTWPTLFCRYTPPEASYAADELFDRYFKTAS